MKKCETCGWDMTFDGSHVCKLPEQASSCNSGLLRGEKYNFKNQPERLLYVGKAGSWHQFEKIGEQGVWCELLDEDLHMIEKTVAA